MEDNKLINKYRPSSLDDVVGHKAIVKSLKTALKKNELDQAILLHGYYGNGKTTIARILANQLTVSNNIYEIDSGNNNGVDFVKELVEYVRVPAFDHNPKVVIVDEVQNLASSSAWTALFKVIETPPKHLYWILCTSDFDKVPKAIQRRCSSYKLTTTKVDVIKNYLGELVEKEGITIGEDVIDLIAMNSNGSVGVALGNLQTVRYTDSLEEAAEMLEVVLESKEVIDLCRYLANPENGNFNKAKMLLNDLKNMNPESIRIQLVRYIQACIIRSKGADELKFLSILSSLNINPLPSTTGFASLLLVLADVFCECKE